MNRNALIASILAAATGVALLRLYLYRFEQETMGGAPTAVLVLVKDAPAGTVVTRELLGRRGLPQAYLESRHVLATDIEQVLDTRLGIAVRASETLLWSDLSSMRAPSRQLSTLVPEGMRAFTLAAHDSASDALLLPGDRVDVLLTSNAGESERAEPSTTLVAQNVLVLAVGDNLGGVERRRDRASGRSGQVTLSVTPTDGLRLAQAEHRGLLRVTVRNPDDLAVTDSNLPPNTISQPAPALTARNQD